MSRERWIWTQPLSETAGIVVTHVLALIAVVACSRPGQESSVDVSAGRAFEGFTLFTSLGGDGTHHLVDMDGVTVHEWKTAGPAHYGWLLPNGHLVTSLERTTGIGTEHGSTPAGRAIGAVVELDWDGNVVREWKNDSMHHDFDLLPNGNLLALRWVEHPNPTAVEGGIPGTEYAGGVILSLVVSEIAPSGEIVWEWNAVDHLDPEAYPICPIDFRRRWLHANSLQYLPADNDLFVGRELILLSLRQPSAVIIVDRHTGEVRWRYGGYVAGEWGRLGHQHDFGLIGHKTGGPELPGYGHLLVFDNGMHVASPTDRGVPRTRILELDPHSREVVWRWVHEEPFNGPTPLEFKFNSPFLGGAQRLPNGDTLVTDGAAGRNFEVTSDGETVWEVTNPEKRPLFRAYRYPKDFPGFAGRGLR